MGPANLTNAIGTGNDAALPDLRGRRPRRSRRPSKHIYPTTTEVDEEMEDRPLAELEWEELQQLKSQAARLFSPRMPIATQELFSGRLNQILRINSIIAQPGAHAIIYGERGVGKTSLANIAPISYHVYHEVPLREIVAVRVNCDGTDTYDALWRKVFRNINVVSEYEPVGFMQATEEETHSLISELNHVDKFTPGEVQDVLNRLGQKCQLIITLDEFDRLPGEEVPRLIADTIKSLSDNQVPATIQVVGVGDSVAALVRGHESVGRHLVEVPLPRMSRDELEKIVTDRLPQLNGMSIDDSALKYISLVCAGLPYFTHLLGQHAVCNATDDNANLHNYETEDVLKSHVEAAMKRSIEDSEREMKEAYYAATQSRNPSSTFHITLAACALTRHDEFGYFSASNVRDTLENIKDAPAEISKFVGHLDRFCKSDKGAVLDCTGTKHQRRYRFHNPLMQPFVIIRSLDNGYITVDNIKAFAN